MGARVGKPDRGSLRRNGRIAGNRGTKGVLRGGPNALVGPLLALLGVDVVLVRVVSGEVGRLEGLGLAHVKGLDGFHQRVVHHGGTVHRDVGEAQRALTHQSEMGGLGILRVAGAPHPGAGGVIVEIGVCIGVVQPEGNVDALDLIEVVFLGEELGQQLFLLHKGLELQLGVLLAELEGENVVGLERAGEAARQHDGVPAEGAVGRAGVGVGNDLAAAGFAGIDVHLRSLVLGPFLGDGFPLHFVGGGLVQSLVLLHQRSGVKGRVAVRTLHQLRGGVEFHDAAAAWAFVFENFGVRHKSSDPPGTGQIAVGLFSVLILSQIGGKYKRLSLKFKESFC